MLFAHYFDLKLNVNTQFHIHSYFLTLYTKPAPTAMKMKLANQQDNMGGNFPLFPNASKTAMVILQYKKLMNMVNRKPTAIPDLPDITKSGAPNTAIIKQANGKALL